MATRKRKNTSLASRVKSLIPSKYIPAKIRRDPKTGKIKVQISPRNLKRNPRNVAAGFYDEEGIFHPIRASHDYKPRRAGEKAKRKPAAKRKRPAAKRKRPAAKRKRPAARRSGRK